MPPQNQIFSLKTRLLEIVSSDSAKTQPILYPKNDCTQADFFGFLMYN